MASLTTDPDGPDDFPSHVQEVRERLAKSVARAGLKCDAYGQVVEALSETLSVLPAFVEEVTQAKEPWTVDERREVVRAAANDMHSEIGRLVGAELRNRTTTAGIVGAVLLFVGIICGYLAGQHGKEGAVAVAEARAVKIDGDLSAAANGLTRDQAQNWAIVLRENPNVSAAIPSPSACSRDEQQAGRQFCWARFWIEAAKPPTPSVPPAIAPTEAPASKTIMGRKSG